MKTKLTLILFAVIIFFIISIPFSATAQTTDVLTQHNNLNRDGWDSTETILNTKNVKFGLFGKLCTRSVDDFIYAQLLIKNNVNIPGKGSKNIVYAATVNNSVYAFDADDSSVTSPYWQVNLTPTGMRPVNNTDIKGCGGNYKDIIGNIGIIGTPVIDPATNTMYLVARSCNTNGTGYVQYLHALDITTGAEQTNSPQLISAQVNGTGMGSAGGKLTFDPLLQNQRAGLLLLNGIVYICYASHCDWGFYHGWILGYDKNTLQQTIVYCTTPDGNHGGMWMSGAGPSADDAGNLYVSVGNGTAGYNGDLTDIRNRSESSLKLKPSSGSLSVESFFTPNNYTTLEATDLDFGTSQFMLLPNTNLGVTACKDGHIYVINKDSMGGYDSITNQVVQTINLATNAHLRSAFAYYGGSQHQYVYSWSENGLLTAFPFDNTGDTLDVQNEIRSGVQGPVGNSGAFLSVSSNGSIDSTAVLWATFAKSGDANQQTRPGILHAFDATDVTKELWNSSQATGDSVGNYAKFNCPTIANGKVYLATFSNQFNVYGLTGNNLDTCNSADIALNKPAYASSTSYAYVPENAFDGDPSTRWSSEGGVDPEYIYVDLGARYDLCRVVLNWEAALASNFTIDVSDDAVNWTTIATRTNNTNYSDYISVQGTGRYVRMYGTARGGLPEWGYSLYSFEVYGTKNALDCPAPDSLWTSDISQNSATLHWNSSGASQYHVQYKSVSDPDWTAIIVDTNFLVLNSLSCGTDYLFKVQGTCSATDSSDFSTVTPFSSLSCNGCNPLPTRWSSSDVGNVNVAGTSCYNAGVFALKGSGDDIGGTADAFQFAYQTLNGDAEFTARVATLDNANASNKCGIMIRETLSSGSKYAFIGLTSSSGVTFETRSTTNGNTSVTNSANTISVPYWIRLTKSGSVFNAAISSDNVNYSPLGSTSDLGFGNLEEVYAGLAITSHDNNILSAGTVDNYGYTTGTLPIDLLSFNASLNVNHTVDVKWSTQAINTGYFVVERATSPGNFIALDSVQTINGQSIQSYTLTDNAPVAGTNYYRLRIVDANGNYSYSGIVTINVNNGIAPLIYPNPATSYINIVQGNEPIKYVTLHDITGRMIEKLNTVSNAGTIKFSVSHIPKGIYFIEMTTTNSIYRSKIIID